MLTEVKCGKTHVQLFADGVCVATVRAEYVDAVKDAIEKRLDEIAQALVNQVPA